MDTGRNLLDLVINVLAYFFIAMKNSGDKRGSDPHTVSHLQVDPLTFH